MVLPDPPYIDELASLRSLAVTAWSRSMRPARSLALDPLSVVMAMISEARNGRAFASPT